MNDQTKDKAEGRVHQQKNPDGSTSNYDDTGDEVKKNDKGEWVKNKSTQSTGATPSTTSVNSTKTTT